MAELIQADPKNTDIRYPPYVWNGKVFYDPKTSVTFPAPNSSGTKTYYPGAVPDYILESSQAKTKNIFDYFGGNDITTTTRAGYKWDKTIKYDKLTTVKGETDITHYGTLLLRKWPSVESPDFMEEPPYFEGGYNAYGNTRYLMGSGFVNDWYDGKTKEFTIGNFDYYHDTSFDYYGSAHGLGYWRSKKIEYPGRVIYERINSYSKVVVDHQYLSDLKYYITYKDYKSNEAKVEFEFAIESQLLPTHTIFTMKDGRPFTPDMPSMGYGGFRAANVHNALQKIPDYYNEFNYGLADGGVLSRTRRGSLNKVDKLMPLGYWEGTGMLADDEIAWPYIGGAKISSIPSGERNFESRNARIEQIRISVRRIIAKPSGKGINCVEPFKNYQEVGTITIPRKYFLPQPLAEVNDRNRIGLKEAYGNPNYPNDWTRNTEDDSIDLPDQAPWVGSGQNFSPKISDPLLGYGRHKVIIEGGKAWYVGKREDDLDNLNQQSFLGRFSSAFKYPKIYESEDPANYKLLPLVINWTVTPGRFEPDAHYYLTVSPQKDPLETVREDRKWDTEPLTTNDGYLRLGRIWPIHYKVDKYWLMGKYGYNGNTTGYAPRPINGKWANGNYRINDRFNSGDPSQGGWSSTTLTNKQKTILDKLATEKTWSDVDSLIDAREFYMYGYNITSYAEATKDPDTTKWTKRDLIDAKSENFAWFRTPTQELKELPKELTLPASVKNVPNIKTTGYTTVQTNSTGTKYEAELKAYFFYKAIDLYRIDEFLNNQNVFLLSPLLLEKANALNGKPKREGDVPVSCGFRHKLISSTTWTDVKVFADLSTRPFTDYVRTIPRTTSQGTLTATKVEYTDISESLDDKRQIVFTAKINISINEPVEYQVWVETKDGTRYYADPSILNKPPASIPISYPVVIGDVKLPGFIGPNSNSNGHWYQVFESWKYYNSTEFADIKSSNNISNLFYPLLAVKPPIPSISGSNFALGPHYIYYYLNRTFVSNRSYQFRIVTDGYYDGLLAALNTNRYSTEHPRLGLVTPWGEVLDNTSGIGTPYLPSPFSGGGVTLGIQKLRDVRFNIYVHTNINAYIKTKNTPQKPQSTLYSTTNPKNPITISATNKFNLYDGYGISYLGIYENEWVLQGYATFNVMPQQDGGMVKPINTEQVPYYDLLSGEFFAGKGWHYLNDFNRLVWFDKVGKNTEINANTVTVPYAYEINENLPCGGDVNDYQSSKKCAIDYLVNNFAAVFVTHQKFNLRFDYYNYSGFGISLYVGSRLPYKISENEWYKTNIDALIEQGLVKKVATISDFVSPEEARTIDFVGLQGNQYLFFVADPIIKFEDQSLLNTKNIEVTSTGKRLFKTGTLQPAGYEMTNGSVGFGTYSIINITNINISAALATDNNRIFNTNNDWSTFIPNSKFVMRLGNSNNLIPGSPNSEINIYTKAGNGSFNSGIWENGTWNTGWRDDYTVREFFGVSDFTSTDRNSVWLLKITGSKESCNSFQVGDRVSISNLALLDINSERRLYKRDFKVVDYTDDYIEVTFEYDFPLHKIEIDSEEHRILISRNVWLRGVFFNGYFKGIWNDGIFSGFPYLTKMDESHWIDGVFNGGHFTAYKKELKFFGLNTFNYENFPMTSVQFAGPHGLTKNDVISLTYSTADELISLGKTVVLEVPDSSVAVVSVPYKKDFADANDGTVYTTISTGLIQNFDFYSNNSSRTTSIDSLISESVFSYNSWIDVNYSRQSAVNIGRPETYNEDSSDRPYSENNLYGYPTLDVLSSKSVFRDSFSTNLRRYRLGTKYKIFNDYVGNVSDFTDDFESTDTQEGIKRFNELGWAFNKVQNTVKEISTYGQYYNTQDGFLRLIFTNNAYTSALVAGDFVIFTGLEKITTRKLVKFNNTWIWSGTNMGSTQVPEYETTVSIKPKTDFLIVDAVTTEEWSDGTLATEIKLNNQRDEYLLGVPNTIGHVTVTTEYDVTNTTFDFTVQITPSNGLTFSRTSESATLDPVLVGKELRVEATNDGGILNLIPAYEVAKRENGLERKTIPKFRYSMVEFDLLKYESDTPTSSRYYREEEFGEIPPLHFNNINLVLRDRDYGSYTKQTKLTASYLPVFKNVNHLDTVGTKKQEFFFNKTNLLMTLTGIGEYGTNKSTFYIDNLKLYEVDSIPFFKYFTKLNINRAAVVPNSTAIYGQSPIIDYTDLDNIVEDEILSFYDKLLRQKLSIPESVNWEMDYTIYRPQNEAAVQFPELYQTEIDDSIARASQLSAAKSEVELDQNDPLTNVLDPALNQQKFSISGLNWRPSDGNLNI